MTVDEILEVDAKRNKPRGTTAKHSKFRINRWFERGGQLVQDEKTLFLFVGDGKGAVETHAYTADDPAGFAESLKRFAELMKKLGVKELVTVYVGRPKLLEFMKRVSEEMGVRYSVEDEDVYSVFRAYLQE